MGGGEPGPDARGHPRHRAQAADPGGSRPSCPEEAPPGTTVSTVLETSGDKSRVIVLDALWQWSEKCEAVRLNPVWVPTAAISENYPTR